MAAGGIGGLAVGLAARDMIANFFGGLTVFIDRPFGVGDWIMLAVATQQLWILLACVIRDAGLRIRGRP